MDTYRNSTEVCNLNGQPIYLEDVTKACLIGGLNLFLQGDTGSGKTQLARDVMSYFPNSMFILGRNDMDTRELFQQINPEFLKAIREGRQPEQEIKSLTDKINTNLTVVDELPNCVPAVRAQLFNLFDGFIEVNGIAYPIGQGYSIGIATGNIGQQFTESSNELGRALKDRMHVIVDVDYFHPDSSDTLEILTANTDPRVQFSSIQEDKSKEIKLQHTKLKEREISFWKLVVANYLIHGLDYCEAGSKREMKSAWPTQLEQHEQASDVGLILPLSTRAAKSVIRLSQALDDITIEKGAESLDSFESMMQAYRLVAPYSGVLNEEDVQNKKDGNHYDAIDAIITTTREQFVEQDKNLAAGLEMVNKGKKIKEILDLFGTEQNPTRWTFVRGMLENQLQQ